jgi:hypothetical protein
MELMGEPTLMTEKQQISYEGLINRIKYLYSKVNEHTCYGSETYKQEPITEAVFDGALQFANSYFEYASIFSVSVTEKGNFTFEFVTGSEDLAMYDLTVEVQSKASAFCTKREDAIQKYFVYGRNMIDEIDIPEFTMLGNLVFSSQLSHYGLKRSCDYEGWTTYIGRFANSNVDKGEVSMDNEVIKERTQTYGEFSGVAQLSQDLKAQIKIHTNWHDLGEDKKEALEMILHKVARIVNGDPNYKDSWVDIAGYAELIYKDLN